MRIAPQIVFDTNENAGQFGDLPEWDLTDLYASTDAPEYKRDLDWLEKACTDFAVDYEGKLADLDATGMLDCVLRYEKIQSIGGRIMSFVGLQYYQNPTDAVRRFDLVIFDCDGVLVDSEPLTNRVMVERIYQVCGTRWKTAVCPNRARPGIYVHRLIQGEHEKRIEQRTVRQKETA